MTNTYDVVSLVRSQMRAERDRFALRVEVAIVLGLYSAVITGFAVWLL